MAIRAVRIPFILSVILPLVAGSCASIRDRGGAGTREILGEDAKEGKVVEGEIARMDPGPPGSPRLGYRIQIVAVRSREEAERTAEGLRRRWTDPVHIEYYEPYYKVRVGDFPTRDDAEDARVRAVAMGFKDAWVVETPISPE